jgi:four helix bundle protein
MVREAEHAQSKADFLSKMNIGLKEANESAYWLILLRDTYYLSKEEFNSLNSDCEELIRLFASIVKTTKSALKK